MQGIRLRVWRHRRYKTTLPLDSRAGTVDSPWCPSSMPARVPAPSAQALKHRDGLHQDHLACHNRPSACPGALGVPCLLWPILPEDLMRHHAWQKRRGHQHYLTTASTATYISRAFSREHEHCVKLVGCATRAPPPTNASTTSRPASRLARTCAWPHAWRPTSRPMAMGRAGVAAGRPAGGGPASPTAATPLAPH